MSDLLPQPQLARRQIVAAAEAMLAGRVSLTEGARRLRSLAPRDFDPDFQAFVALDSDTDAFILGEPRQHWSAADLASMDAERVAVEVHWREEVLAACRALLDRLAAA